MASMWWVCPMRIPVLSWFWTAHLSRSFYMKEGTVFLPASATIIKGAKNMDNAKLFIDFILSEEVQNIWGSTLTNRPVMKDAATNDAMTPDGRHQCHRRGHSLRQRPQGRAGGQVH